MEFPLESFPKKWYIIYLQNRIWVGASTSLLCDLGQVSYNVPQALYTHNELARNDDFSDSTNFNILKFQTVFVQIHCSFQLLLKPMFFFKI